MKKIGIWVFLCFTILSCKKYDEDKYFSTYTVKGRLANKGVWRLIEVEDLSLQAKVSLLQADNFYLEFDFDKSTCYLKKNTSVGFEDIAMQLTQFLKPALVDKMIEPSDSIVIQGKSFELSSDKNRLLLKNYIDFGYFMYPQMTYGFTVRNSVDIDFKIDRLEFGYMNLSYENRLVFKFKKEALQSE
jgi:hypothetical protein